MGAQRGSGPGHASGRPGPWALSSPFVSVAVAFVLEESAQLWLSQGWGNSGNSGCGEAGEQQGRPAALTDGPQQDPSDSGDPRPGTRASSGSRTLQLDLWVFGGVKAKPKPTSATRKVSRGSCRSCEIFSCVPLLSALHTFPRPCCFHSPPSCFLSTWASLWTPNSGTPHPSRVPSFRVPSAPHSPQPVSSAPWLGPMGHGYLRPSWHGRPHD